MEESELAPGKALSFGSLSSTEAAVAVLKAVKPMFCVLKRRERERAMDETDAGGFHPQGFSYGKTKYGECRSVERRLEAERGRGAMRRNIYRGDDGSNQAIGEMERPLPGPKGMVDDSTWTGKDRRPKRRERNNRGGF